MLLLILEIIGVITGVLAAWYARKNNKLTWYYGVVSVTIFTYLFWLVGLVGSVILQLYFIGISFVGMYTWQTEIKYPIKYSSLGKIAISFIIVLLLSVGSGYIISHSAWLYETMGIIQYPYWDSFIWIGSMMAVGLMSIRLVESWIYWILVDIVAIFVYINVGMYFTSIYFLILLLNAVWGFYDWNKKI